eukprot:CAMPEP_0116958726 /NCGR_PEP_ID=MMETSP0467-20121206/44823_1 /TAXON_ID=283647 /ORGANISM="Mesodinium pulex, Strain SPMC105" /LENGTH=98 /DNA_ID=CAMNT_0004645891 /DNA_START=343 /DNA_END=636 /DNA_ORIENTATION=+
MEPVVSFVKAEFLSFKCSCPPSPSSLVLKVDVLNRHNWHQWHESAGRQREERVQMLLGVLDADVQHKVEELRQEAVFVLPTLPVEEVGLVFVVVDSHV